MKEHIKSNVATLWTIQTREAFETLNKTGKLFYAEAAHKNSFISDGYYTFAYDWMKKKMIEHIGNPDMKIEYPMWAWYQWEGKRKRMDLRCGGYAPRGTKMVQIEFEMPYTKILLSDFDVWHYVLGRWYVFESLEDLEKSQMNDIDNNKETMERIEKSWDRIFDLEHCKTVIGENGPQSIQATFWKLEIENVKKVEFFSAK